MGLKVDADALPEPLKKQLKAGKVNLDDPATTVALLKLNAVVGVTSGRRREVDGHPVRSLPLDRFQADRSPTHMYRTAPLAGLWTHQKGGFYHDGRFATLSDVLQHYNRQCNLNLTDEQTKDLIEYLKGI